MDTVSLLLAIIGAINWGLVGIFQFDLVAWIFGGQAAGFSRVIYTLVGLAGLWCISLLFRKNHDNSKEESHSSIHAKKEAGFSRLFFTYFTRTMQESCCPPTETVTVAVPLDTPVMLLPFAVQTAALEVP